MSMPKWIGEIIGGSGKEIITGLADTADRFIQTKEEKDAFSLEVKRYELQLLELKMKAEDKYAKDRQSAREMYMNDSSLQKTFAIVFLIAYCLISSGMIAMVISMAFFNKTVDLPDWGVMLITSVFTAMSSKVATITDFLFGGSKQSTDNSKQINDAFRDGQ